MTAKTVELLKKEIPFETKYYKSDDGSEYLEGYANTKDVEDRVGDIPHNLNAAPVYLLKEFKKNPVALVDHMNSAGHIVGSFVQIAEDEKGLKFKLKFMSDPQTPIAKHAKAAYIEGHGRAFSIGYSNPIYGDPQNPKHLTSVNIHEISLVGVPADSNALSDVPMPKGFGQQEPSGMTAEVLKGLISEVRQLRSELCELEIKRSK